MSLRSMKILIGDDAATNVELLDHLLRFEGFETLMAADGATARQIANEQQPDLILLDVMMPGESGIETCAKLKSNPGTVDIPIIFLSALEDVKSKISGLKRVEWTMSLSRCEC